MVCAEGTARPNPNEPCPWPVEPEACDDCWDQYPIEVQERAIVLATSLLWRLSGRQFGCCCITVRPCVEGCIDAVSTYAGWSGVGLTGVGGTNDILRPAILDGKWVNCGCVADCCGAECELTLPVGPVCQVDEVIIDGVIQDINEFSVINGRRLVWNSPTGQCFPDCNDFGKDVTEEGTWAVTYRWGLEVPADGLFAAGKLASEFAKACVGDNACQLPRRVQTLTRNGVSATFIDDGNFFERGLTGIFDVDMWLRSINPYGLMGRSRVYVPGKITKAARTTWTP